MSTPMFVVTHVAPYQHGPAGVHGVLPQAAIALSELATLAGLEPRVVTDPTALDPADLAGGGVLCLFTIGETPWSGPQRQAVVDAVRAGRLGVLSIHSASDASRAWPEYGELVGARFDGHPWTADFDITVVDPAHPSTAHLPATWRWRDEVYLFASLRPDAHVVLRADESTLDMNVPEARVPDCGFPLAWCFTEGRGRCFYTSLGHFPHAWEYPIYLNHVAGGLAWVLG
ncbi:MAG TPA: ThuA domain-containing protein [Acidimicrobiales bacterium]|nr:ThuA domain-containing protein [Acidimicrobiales bacterium]